MKINYIDMICTFIILLSLILIPSHHGWWLFYALGCACWIYLHFTKKLYFGMLMNFVALIIGIFNFFRG